MALTVTITYALKVGSQYRIGFKAAASGSYPSGGDTLNFATATVDPNFVGAVPQVEALGAPLSFDLWSQGGNTTIGYVPQIGTLQTNCKVRMMSALGTEVTPGTYAGISSTITADTIVGEATFNSL